MRYVVEVNGARVDVDIDGGAVRVDGVQVSAALEPLPGTPLAILSLGGSIHRVFTQGGGGRGRYLLSLGGRRYEAEALDERTRAIRALSAASTKPGGPAPLVAPMPGLVVRVNVAPGDPVQAGQGLVVMEAMKMENELRAASAGVVRAILVGAGAAVEKGAVLVELD